MTRNEAMTNLANTIAVARKLKTTVMLMTDEQFDSLAFDESTVSAPLENALRELNAVLGETMDFETQLDDLENQMAT